jgi:hypothetical protein
MEVEQVELFYVKILQLLVAQVLQALLLLNINKELYYG